MPVRAKFKVNSIARSMGSKHDPVAGKWIPQEQQTIALSAVYGNGDPNHENTKFWNASPAGEIKLTTINVEAGNYFELDKEYYIDFIRAN